MEQQREGEEAPLLHVVQRLLWLRRLLEEPEVGHHLQSLPEHQGGVQPEEAVQQELADPEVHKYLMLLLSQKVSCLSQNSPEHSKELCKTV